MPTDSQRQHETWMQVGIVVGMAAGLWAWRKRVAQRRAAQLREPLRPGGARTALVTGASSGIGAAYARSLAARGYDLILVARRVERLNELAAELMPQHGIRAEVLAADLSNPRDLDAVAARIVAGDFGTDGAPLALLVNNAGFGANGMFVTTTPASQEAMVLVNVNAPVRLTRAALPGMLARGGGAVINVSSIAAFAPFSKNATYCATKAAINTFTLALHQELQGTRVQVQALCPGFTRTEFQQAAGIVAEASLLPDWMWMTAESVVACSLAALETGEVIVVPGWGNRLLVEIVRRVPQAFFSLFARLRVALADSGSRGKGVEEQGIRE